MEKAVHASAVDEDWEQRLSTAVGEFHDCIWPLDYLRGGAATTASGNGR
jgi:hypothetical protein